MSRNKPEQLIRQRAESLERKPRKSGGLNVWSIVGGTALLVMAAAVLVNLPDIKRYIRISTM